MFLNSSSLWGCCNEYKSRFNILYSLWLMPFTLGTVRGKKYVSFFFFLWLFCLIYIQAVRQMTFLSAEGHEKGKQLQTSHRMKLVASREREVTARPPLLGSCLAWRIEGSRKTSLWPFSTSRERINRRGNGCLRGWIVIGQGGMVLNWDRGGLGWVLGGSFSHRGWWRTGTGCPRRLWIASPSPEAFKARLNVALGSLVWWLVTLHIAAGLKLNDHCGPFQPRPFYDEKWMGPSNWVV